MVKHKPNSLQKKIIISACICLLVAVCAFFICSIHASQTPPFKAQLQYAKINNATIAYYTRGTGEPLILLSGFGMNMQGWDPELLRKLSTQYTLFLFDYRGVGKSTGDTSQISESQLADDVVELMDTAGITKAHFLGWSMGSFIAQAVAERYPTRVDKLILVSTGPDGKHMITQPNNTDTTLQNNLADSWEGIFVPLIFANTPDSQEAIRTYLRHTQTGKQTGEVPADEPEDVAIRIAQEQAFANPQQEQDRYDALPSISAPTLIIAGEKDSVILPENDKLVAARIPNAQLTIIPNASHAVLFQKIDVVSEMIKKFLQ